SPSRLLAEIARPGDGMVAGKRPARSVTVNVTESPLGWLFARGHVSPRQYDAGEQLRLDWERSQMAPRVTMAWDAAPVSRSRSRGGWRPEQAASQVDAKRRFDEAVAEAG